jgi:hypothetical protein
MIIILWRRTDTRRACGKPFPDHGELFMKSKYSVE